MSQGGLAPNTGSFRDPTGRVYEREGRIFRLISGEGVPEYEFVRDSGLLLRLAERGWIVGSQETQPDGHLPAGMRGVWVEHPRIPFVSYPYEWPFSALQRAALLHLDLHLELLKAGGAISDATAYNIQFDGPKPVFIDISSLRRYRSNEAWLGHRQFCDQFLNPLLLLALTGVSYHAWYRGNLEGISALDLARLLPWRCRMDWRVLAHVVLQARLQTSAARADVRKLRDMRNKGLRKPALEGLLQQMRSWIASLKPKGLETSTWADYERTHTYQDDEHRKKLRFVSEFAAHTRPQMLWDLGCNTGEYSSEVLRAGAGRVIGFDYDLGALETAFDRAQREKLRFLPLFLDAANPSPRQGWNQSERVGLMDRGPADAVIALAFEHHLTIGRNVPIPEFLDWLTALAPAGIVEFVPKDDPTVTRMLSLRDDVFAGYSSDAFREALAQRSRVIQEEVVSSTGRMLFWYQR